MNYAPITTTTAAILGLMIVQLLLIVQAYREHKVHNIVLYPDKHSWCKTTTIKQVISYPGCTSIEIDNNVCVGACFSYSIPHTEPSDPGEVIVPYCDSCQPSETTWHQITLQCSKNDADTPSQLIKHVQIIHNCSCTSCEKDSVGIAKFPENNEDFFLQQSADAELLDALQSRRNESNHLENNERSKKMHSLLNHKLITLLRNIQANNSEHDKEQLFDLFNVMQEPMKHKVKAKNIIDFIETLQSNKTDLDTTMLTEILLKFEYPKHYKIDIPHIADNAMVDDGIEELKESPSPIVGSSSLPVVVGDDSDVAKDDSTQKQRVPIAVWIQNPASSEVTSPSDEEHHNDGDDTNEEIDKPNPILDDHEDILPQVISSTEKVLDAVSISPISISDQNEQEEKRPDVSSVSSEHDQSSELDSGNANHHHQHHTHLHLHQHHVNDNIVSSHGHLARGPHGALVIEPDRIHEEKLDVNAHELKPNHAGTLLSYHSHSGEGNSR
ncbi:homeobox protein cut-like isoform X2 [Episyrphus balteatus]|nr:homeobox protein cut-like isoform X2 [Episyrphus balteatus]XP_055857885.1 homeobox protein cut-like isoform X2 [Episyrphus balteatus]XP_055857886.1 homeobox protein cut-like isoform X2 [Episyrphus balteatus]XP_055857887.1 homeobox protein cut-like isoform X2 [Episyrphus balteatus]